MVMVFAAARRLALAHPDKVEDFIREAPEAVERAGKDLGMYMGISYLADKVGLPAQEGIDAMNSLWGT